ncbi:MAG: hypothetical protein J7M21_05100 [Planctomycetes bacterium]|nr:hypothetical protein [Planctomycetota bacterium]
MDELASGPRRILIIPAGATSGVHSPSSASSKAQPRGLSSSLAKMLQARAAAARAAAEAKSASSSQSTKTHGNAVYRIGPDGLIESIFRRPVTILAMVRRDDKLLLATGNGGQVYSVTTDGDEVSVLADTDAKQVTAIVAGPGGEVLFATANKGSVGRLAGRYARKGTFVCKPMDAGQIARWGTIQLFGRAPQGTSVTVATRSGNVAEPDEKTWSSWSKEMPLQAGFLPIGTPAGRFLQYRLTLTSNGRATPIVGGVEIVYQVGNLAPVVAGISVQASAKGKEPGGPASGPKVYRHILIKAGDQNHDRLRFILSFRRIGTDKWVPITDRLTEPKFVWDTRSVADGRYEIRVTASDDPSNPRGSARTASRISEPIVVDNTPPLVSALAAKAAGGRISVSGRTEEAASRIVAIAYALDSQSEWRAISPADGICDSNRERFAFDIEDVKAGTHRVALRVEDLYGNVGYGSVIVQVGK